ncbi:kinase-like protein [Suillus weaverae]|nr:kinase-like protein [Suillus weaverae]
MASGSKQPATAANKSILTTVWTLEGHTEAIPSICYFPDGKHIASGSYDKTARQWDLQTEQEVDAVVVSRDGRWIITAGGESDDCGEIKAHDIKTGIVKTFHGHSDRINCIDISADCTLLASGAEDRTMRIWNLDTGKLVAGPFKSADKVGAIRFSLDSKMLAAKSCAAKCLEVWDVQAQKLNIRLGKYDRRRPPELDTPVFWTMKDKSILAAFSFVDEKAGPIYEFDASTLQFIGAPFEGHTDTISGLALSFDCVLLASASIDQTIKLWASESRQLLASFSVQRLRYLILSPDSSQLSYTTNDDTKIHVCDTPPDILASMRPRISAHEYDFPPEAMLQDLTGYITRDAQRYPIACSSFWDIWKCTYHIDRRSVKVAVKSLHMYAANHMDTAKVKKIKGIMRELEIYASLNHANILPMYGYTYGFGPFIAIVRPWAENGNLTTYLAHQGETLTLVRRFQILKDIIAGLQYLHTNSVIHGNLSAANVLIDSNATACIVDFGLSPMYSSVAAALDASWTSTPKGNMQWMAPELLVEQEDDSPTRPSEQSDMYSFGGIMLQVLTNKAPYYYLLHDASIILCVAKSQTPSRSRYPELPEQYWQLIEQCWSTDPRERPSTEKVDGQIKNEFQALSRASQNPRLAVLHDLTRYITKDEEYPVAGGGFGEIWKCTYKKDRISIKVAVKSLRVYAADQGKEKKNERIQRELGICASLKHANVLPVYGYTSGFSPFIAIVSHWAENGDLTAYLKRVGKTLTAVQRFQILRDVITGLQYLHVNRVIHGDFNGVSLTVVDSLNLIKMGVLA